MDLPRFDERFVGFGYNKVSFVMELDAMNYEMVVHPFAFVVHRFHAKSTDNLNFLAKQQYSKCLFKLKKAFASELSSKYSVDIEKNF